MKKTLLAMLIAGMTFGSASVAAKTDIPELSKELEIMTNIMQTALRHNNDRQGIRFRSIDVTYLDGQGVVFEINTSGGGFHFDIGDMLSGLNVPVAPVPPVSISSDEQQFVIEFDEGEWQELAREASEAARDALRDAQHKLRDLREREREYSWEEREYERRKRDLEFEKRNADEKRRAKIEEKAHELEKELKEIEAKRGEISRYAKEIEEEQKQQEEKRNAAKKAQYTRFLSNFEASIGDVLCKYGAGIKALPQDENVSFILPKFGSASKREKQDRIYVFKQKDIQSCVRDKIDSNKLLEDATTYMF